MQERKKQQPITEFHNYDYFFRSRNRSLVWFLVSSFSLSLFCWSMCVCVVFAVEPESFLFLFVYEGNRFIFREKSCLFQVDRFIKWK